MATVRSFGLDLDLSAIGLENVVFNLHHEPRERIILRGIH